MRNDVNLNRSLIVKGWRSIDRLHNIHYQTFKNEQATPMGQGSCQNVKIIQGTGRRRGSGIRVSPLVVKINSPHTHEGYLE